MSQPPIKLNTVIIFTSRINELAKFYENALGLGPWQEAPGHLGCQIGEMYFGFDQKTECTERSNCGITIWFEVKAIREQYSKLISCGAREISPPQVKPWGAILASVSDPDGNLIGLSEVLA